MTEASKTGLLARMALHRFTIATLFIGVTPWSGAEAQGTASTNNFYCVAENPLAQQIVTVANSSISRTCTGAGMTATTSASAIGGVLRASTSFLPSSIPAGNSIVASASWDDYLRVRTGTGAPSAAFAKLTMALNGQLDPGPKGSASIMLQVRGGEVVDLGHILNELDQPRVVTETFDYLVPLGGGNGLYGASFYMAMFSGAGGGGSSSLFSNSAGVTGLSILDANGQTITDATYSWDRGLTLYQPTTIVPEPSVVMLLVAGFSAMVAMRTYSVRRQ